MDIALGALTFGTLGFVVAFGYISARSMEKRRTENHPPSALAADARRPARATRIAAE